MTTLNASLSILLVEDDDVDAEAFHRILRKRKIATEVRRVREGMSALQALREQWNEASGHGFLVLLDLNTPGMNGHEFLTEVRADPLLANTIVYVLSTSQHDRDITMAFEKKVAGYFLKSEIPSLLDTLCLQ